MHPIKLLILDVDGVMTRGDLPYDANGNKIKTFYVQDGGAIRSWIKAGNLAAIISGRTSPAVETRAKDLGITLVYQKVWDKLPVYESLRKDTGVGDTEIAYIGDDLLDVPPMRRCGYPIAVANAVPAAKRAARYVTRAAGGEGAVLEAITRLMRYNQKCQKQAEPASSI